MNIALYSYNNYYNRIVKRHSTTFEYVDNGAVEVAAVSGVAFDPGNGIITSQIVNADFRQVVPDYLLCLNEDGYTVDSRWYVMEAVRLREKQYRVSLLRDLVADNYDEVIAAPMFVEKAMLTRNDPRIFNNEDMSYNQIKKSETLLKDKTNVPWIVGYIERNVSLGDPITVPTETLNIDYDLTSLEGYQYHQYNISNPYKMSYHDFTAKMYIRGPGISNDQLQVGWDTWGWPKMPELEINANQPLFEPAGSYCTRDPRAGYRIANAFGKYADVINQVLQHTYGKDWIDTSYSMTQIPRNPADLSVEDGKIIKAGDDYYRIHYHTTITPRTLVTVNSTVAYGQLYQDVVKNCDRLAIDKRTEPVGAIEYTALACYFTYEPITIASITLPITSTRTHLTDAPYDVFAMPYGELTLSNATVTNADVAMRMAQQISIDLNSQLYDVQLLPYCPLGLNANGMIDISKMTENKDYVWATESGGKKSSILFWLSTSSFQVDIPINITVPNDAIDFKVANECDKYRIVSPTYSGEFEFSATKNNGVAGFTAYCTYKPYNPFIKVVPQFNYLYGQEFKDGRGCICQGDFSIPQLSSAWTQYQLNNKNYLNAFNRQVENMEINNAIQRKLEKWQVRAGVFQGAGTGAMAGGMVGGGYGAAAGAILGGAASAAGGMADLRFNHQLRQEALDYTKDQFGYQLGNIQALPYSLANVGALTIISKYFPILEYYSCTDIEKTALRNKIKYNGMSVGTIGTIQDFQKPNEKTYIKGTLIRLENSDSEYQYLNALANELNKGVFI